MTENVEVGTVADIVSTPRERAIKLAKLNDVKIEISRSNDGLVRIWVWDNVKYDEPWSAPIEREEHAWVAVEQRLEEIDRRRQYFARRWSQWEVVT